MVENLQLHSCAPLFVVNSLLGDCGQVVSTSPKRRSGQIHVAVTTGVGALGAPVEFNSTYSSLGIYRKQGRI